MPYVPTSYGKYGRSSKGLTQKWQLSYVGIQNFVTKQNSSESLSGSKLLEHHNGVFRQKFSLV